MGLTPVSAALAVYRGKHFPIVFSDIDWVASELTAVIVCSLAVGTQLHRAMKRFPVQLALVIDNTVGRDEILVFEKCEYAGQPLVTDRPAMSE